MRDDERLIRVAREKDKILDLFRSRGMRITKQRRLILDIVFEQECTSCKEIYYRAAKRDKNIGIATVYRMVNVLSELGVFRTNTPYQLDHAYQTGAHGCRVILKNQCEVELSGEELLGVLTEALERKGCEGSPEIERVVLM
ncbi:MAG: transcriptional repressor [Lachnospiraceae bacterium]|nr:transcriptional repressor [Lachnospiraceae bacterium]